MTWKEIWTFKTYLITLEKILENKIKFEDFHSIKNVKRYKLKFIYYTAAILPLVPL